MFLSKLLNSQISGRIMTAGDYFIRRVLTAIHGPYAYSRVILPFFLRFWCNVRVFLNTVFSFFL